jgi:hypothetical protein
LGVKVVTADLLGDATLVPRKVRHNSAALAETAIDLASRSRAQQVRQAAIAAQRAKYR